MLSVTIASARCFTCFALAVVAPVLAQTNSTLTKSSDGSAAAQVVSAKSAPSKDPGVAKQDSKSRADKKDEKARPRDLYPINFAKPAGVASNDAPVIYRYRDPLELQVQRPQEQVFEAELRAIKVMLRLPSIGHAAMGGTAGLIISGKNASGELTSESKARTLGATISESIDALRAEITQLESLVARSADIKDAALEEQVRQLIALEVKRLAEEESLKSAFDRFERETTAASQSHAKDRDFATDRIGQLRSAKEMLERSALEWRRLRDIASWPSIEPEHLTVTSEPSRVTLTITSGPISMFLKRGVDVPGTHSPTVLTVPAILLVQTPQRLSIKTFKIVRLAESPEGRRLQFPPPDKRDIVHFNATKVGTNAYRISIPNIRSGEYAIVPPLPKRRAALQQPATLDIFTFRMD